MASKGAAGRGRPHPGGVAAWMVSLWILFAGPGGGYADTYGALPEKIQAALLVKILPMSREMSEREKIAIHVVRAPKTAGELRKALGRSIGKAVLAEVAEGPDLPARPPAALVIGPDADVDRCVRYCRRRRVLSVTGVPALMERGVTLGLAAAGGKPRIVLDIGASRSEGITWHPTLLKLSDLRRPTP